MAKKKDRHLDPTKITARIPAVYVEAIERMCKLEDRIKKAVLMRMIRLYAKEMGYSEVLASLEEQEEQGAS